MAASSAKKSKREVILEILNRHVDPAPKIVHEADAYISYFENELGEQWIFVRRHGANTGMVYGGDLGWEGHEIRFRTPNDVRAELAKQGVRKSMIDRLVAVANPDPLVPSLVLQGEEKAWLNTVWWASSSATDREAELQVVAEWVTEQVPPEMLNKHPNTTEYRAAHQTLALIAGRAAGMRGLDEVATSKLYTEILNMLSRRAKQPSAERG
ncbi:MAG TPA: hypothetical protein VFC00_00810 [Micromonosporaceae bacterium]|nr:hypothetical protein [Micromonosporaceae bacterium]